MCGISHRLEIYQKHRYANESGNRDKLETHNVTEHAVFDERCLTNRDRIDENAQHTVIDDSFFFCFDSMHVNEYLR